MLWMNLFLYENCEAMALWHGVKHVYVVDYNQAYLRTNVNRLRKN